MQRGGSGAPVGSRKAASNVSLSENARLELDRGHNQEKFVSMTTSPLLFRVYLVESADRSSSKTEWHLMERASLKTIKSRTEIDVSEAVAGPTNVTQLLLDWREGDPEALERLMPLVKEELHEIAERYMRRERQDHTLQATALVNELYLRLVDRKRVNWQNRAHFFGFVAQMMRKILVDHARIRDAEKRRKGLKPLPLDEAWDAVVLPNYELIELDDALDKLSKIDERQSQMVELHFFAGLTYREIGEVLNVSPETVKRDWQTARLWLLEQMRPSGAKGSKHD